MRRVVFVSHSELLVATTETGLSAQCFDHLNGVHLDYLCVIAFFHSSIGVKYLLFQLCSFMCV